MSSQDREKDLRTVQNHGAHATELLGHHGAIEPCYCRGALRQSASRRYANLDILRILLALEVLVLHTHAWDTSKVLWLPIHPVAAFVCISGFLIPQSFSTSTGWPHFALKRLLRVGPALALALLIVACLFGKQAAWGTFLFYLTAGLAGSASFDGPLWSLAVEEVLYATHVLARTIRKAWRVETAVLLFIVSCALYARFSQGHPNVERYFRLFSAFFLGNVLSFYKDRIQSVGVYWTVVVFAAALLFVNWGGGSLMLYMAADSVVCASTVVFALSTRQVKFKVHDISYGTYVYHAPLLALFVGHLNLHGLWLWLVVVPTALSLAALSWFFIERPMLRLKNGVGQSAAMEPAAAAEG